MKKNERPRHGWLRDALTDRGHTQHDVATAWGVDDAVVSRFIRTGEPELTFDRAQVVCRMLDIDMNELNLRMKEGVAMRAQPARPNVPPRDKVLAELKEAVQRAREALPGTKIEVTVSYGEERL